jgi:Xaa-Pro aminopeptidase
VKANLDQLMQARRFDALLVMGPGPHNPPMYYLANGVSIGAGSVLIKKRGAAPLLFVNGMERDEAAKSGLRVVDTGQYRYRDLLKEEKGDQTRAMVRYYGLMLAEAGVTGTVTAYGLRDAGAAYHLLNALNDSRLGVTVVGELMDNVFNLARGTKDAAEVKRIRAVAKKTVAVVADTQEFVTSHRAQNGVLVKKDGSRLTIGEVKRRINFKLNELGIVDAEGGTIFAIGRDAGVPHSRGNDRDPITLGKTIVFDIFPAEPGGGYFYDFTRTWCLGYAPDHVLAAYEDVYAAFTRAFKAFRPNALASDYQKMTCDFFESRGHPTIQSNPETTSGYVHSLGHGLGLNVHEWPSLSDYEGNEARLLPGAVFTVEPGLYYPDHPRGGFGVRLEDSVWLNPETLKFEVLAKYSKDLVLKVKQSRK